MLMIDLVAEKKSLGFSSVTQVTEALLVRYLPYTPLARKSRSGAMRARERSRAWSDWPTCRVPKENVSNRPETD
jgi:hypothetical protein